MRANERADRRRKNAVASDIKIGEERLPSVSFAVAMPRAASSGLVFSEMKLCSLFKAEGVPLQSRGLAASSPFAQRLEGPRLYIDA